MAEVELHGRVAAGRVALVDDDDWMLADQYRWSVQERVVSPSYTQGPYARCWAVRPFDGHHGILYLHQLILWRMHVDHVNRYGLDCTRRNLRPATSRQNQGNRGKRPGTSSRFIGVSWWAAGGCWRAQIKDHGKVICLGRFDDEALAAWTRDQAAIRIFGEYARLNFPQGGRR